MSGVGNIELVLLCAQLPFLGYQVKQVVLVLSDLQESPLSPAQAVLLYQRCRLLLACLQYNTQLSQHLRSKFREEFRSVFTAIVLTLSGDAFELEPLCSLQVLCEAIVC